MDTATGVTPGSLLGGSLSVNITVPGTITLGWYTYPGKTIPDNTVIFNIAFTKVTCGTSAITWFDNGMSCVWFDGNFQPLNDIPTSTYYINGSITFTGPLAANFLANDTIPPRNTTVQFTDLTAGCPTGWNWTFDRTTIAYVNGTTANSQNPQVQFTDGGPYTVTLYAYNSSYNSTIVKTAYIWAGTPGLWTGAVSDDWNTAANWDNDLVPTASTNVDVPSNITTWPEYTNFIVGVNCNTLTLNGNSEVIITGDFIINAGGSLIIPGNGTLQVGGNWTNAGTFNTSSGTIVFDGSTPSTIISGGSFYNLTVSKTGGATLIIPANTTITVAGNMTINQ
jgi:PKD repeat protein